MSNAIVAASSQIARAGQEPAEAEIAVLAATLDLRQPMSIAAFGQEVGARTAAYADELLGKARSSDLGDAGVQLNEVVAATKAFDLSSLDNGWARAPLIGGLFRKGTMMKERALARFESVKAQVDKVTANIDATTDRLTARARDFEAMYEGVSAEHGSLTLHLRAAERRLEDLNAELDAVQRREQDTETMEAVSLLEGSRQALEKRIANFSVLRHSTLQTLPMIRVMQANNLLLIEKFHTIQRLTLPAWKRSYALALTLNEQREAARLSDSIDDTTNDLMRRNAHLLHDNAVAIAKTNQRLVIDVDTLREVHDRLVKTVVEVRAVHEDGVRTRAEAIEALGRLREEMIGGVTGVTTAAQVTG